MPLDYKKVTYKGKDYAVINAKYKSYDIPAIIDYKDIKLLKHLEKSWKCHKNGFISTSHPYNGTYHELYLHEIIMAQKNKEYGSKFSSKPILHINRLNLDNRKENLVYRDCEDKFKNMKKKKRTIELPKDAGINPSHIPTYVWYMKENGTHGERFMVDIGKIKWKTTASKKVTLKEKLDQAKKFLRDLKSNKPEIFQNKCMNGEYTIEGKKLAEEFYEIIKMAGYHDFKKKNLNGITDKLIN